MTTTGSPVLVHQDSWKCRWLRWMNGPNYSLPAESCGLRLEVVGTLAFALLIGAFSALVCGMIIMTIREATLAGTLKFLGYMVIAVPMSYLGLARLPRLVDRISRALARRRMAIRQWFKRKLCRPVIYI